MFVEIEKEEKKEDVSVFALDAWINEARKNGFSLDEAMSILKKTNHYGIIKKVIKEINRCKTKEERLAFKEFVLSAIDGRKTTPDAFEGLFKLAQEGGYAREFLDVFTKEKIYEEKDENVKAFIAGVTEIKNYYSVDLSEYDIFIGKSDKDEFRAFVLDKRTGDCGSRYYINYPKRCVFRNCKEVNFDSRDDYSMIEKLALEGIKSVSFNGVKEMPKWIDVSTCKEVDFGGCDLSGLSSLKFMDGAKVIFSRGTKFPKVLDLSNIDEIDLSNCDFSGVEEIKFKEGAKVKFNHAKNLPTNIDFTLFSEVSLEGCNLKDFSDVQFRDGAKVNLTYVKNAPKGINLSKLSSVDLKGSDVDTGVDFSSLDEVDLSGQDLSNWDNMIFKEGAKVNLRGAKNFPKVLDLSKIIVEDMRECDFVGVEEIKFSKSKKIMLNEARNLPEVLDFSEAISVELRYCDLSKVKDIKFKQGADVDIARTVLPEKLDISQISLSNDSFWGCDFAHVKEINFKDNSDAIFRYVKNFPKNMDLSMLKKVSFFDTDLSKVEEIKYHEQASVHFEARFSDGMIFPEILDLSKVGQVIIKNYSKETPKQIKFKDGANVELDLSVYPEVLDFSRCGKVNLHERNVENIHRIIFRDRAQRDIAFKDLSERTRTVVCKKCKFVKSYLSEAFERLGKEDR